MFALIMAGGQGTRLWPVSRKESPKQLLDLIGKNTLLQNTFARIRKGFSPSEIFLATNDRYVAAVKKQLRGVPSKNFFLEPASRDLGPALCLSAMRLLKRDPSASFVTIWSDHHIQNVTGFHKTLRSAEALLEKYPDSVVAIGVTPPHPHPGFGHLSLGKALRLPGNARYEIKKFIRKPTAEQAKQLTASGSCLWNTGYFVCRAQTIVDLTKKYAPQSYAVLKKIQPSIGTTRERKAVNALYPTIEPFDLEQSAFVHLSGSSMLAIRGSFDWIDIGSWKVLKNVQTTEDENLIKGAAIVSAGEDNLVYNYEDKLVAVHGLSELIVVNTPGALLITTKHESEKIKDLVKEIEKITKFRKYL